MAERVEIVAEVGINHGGDKARALEMIAKSSLAGADVIKFQTVNPDLVYKKDDPLYDIFKKVQFSPDDWKELKDKTEACGAEFMSTPGDRESADMLNGLGVNRFKIASDSARDVDFVKYVMAFKKPVLVSMGLVDLFEVSDLINSYGDLPQVVLHCVSKYPPLFSEANLRRITELRSKLPIEIAIGYSDHFTGSESVFVAVSLGAKVIEKHVKLSDDDIDAPVSASFGQFVQMVNTVRRMEGFLWR